MDYADDVTVLVRDAAPTQCATASAIMEAWEAANARLGLDGRLHVDVLAHARK